MEEARKQRDQARQELEEVRGQFQKRKRPSEAEALETENKKLKTELAKTSGTASHNYWKKAKEQKCSRDSTKEVLNRLGAQLEQAEHQLSEYRQKLLDAKLTPEPERVHEWKQRAQATAIERDQTESLRIEAAQKAAQLERDNRELRDELEDWESQILDCFGQKPDETPWTPAEAHRGVELIRVGVKKLREEREAWKKDWQAAADRENDVTTKLVDCADEVKKWEEAAKTLDNGNTLSPEQAGKAIQELRQQADLTPIRNLHSALLRLTSVTPRTLAITLSEVLTAELTSLRQHLLHPPEAELVTPQSKLEDLLERTREAIKGQQQLQRKAWQTFCPDPEIHTPQQLREWIAGLKRNEVHAQGLVSANQAIIFKWENNVGIPLVGERNCTPQAAGGEDYR